MGSTIQALLSNCCTYFYRKLVYKKIINIFNGGKLLEIPLVLLTEPRSTLHLRFWALNMGANSFTDAVALLLLP
jgi:hypothetical protein